MADKPILFKGSMVRAILEGRKTQTRRIVKPQPTVEKGVFEWLPKKKMLYAYQCVNCEPDMSGYSPYGKPGDLLWVRENIRYDSFDDKNRPSEVLFPATISYEATDQDCLCGGRLRPSIHMPRRASRITLKIKDIRAERLQDISEEDAIAEGIVKLSSDRFAHFGALLNNQAGVLMSDLAFTDSTARGAFALLWQSINGTGSWKENPWVWIVEFEAHQCNIDDFIAEKDRQYG